MVETLYSYFEEQLGKNSGALCLSSEKISLTRAQVYERACQIANYLIKVKGLKHGDKVALAFEHSVDYVIAILAVNRAHAVFMPLNKKRIHELQAAIKEEAIKLVLSDVLTSNFRERLAPS